MRFIDQKDIGTVFFLEKAAQINPGIKTVIVIADDAIHPQRQLQGKFKRAHPKCSGCVDNLITGKRVLLENRFDCSINTVIVAFGKFAFIRLAGTLRAKTDFVLCRQG